MINKFKASVEEAVSGVFDGATVMISGFRDAGRPSALIHALINQGARDLTIIHNNAGNGELAVGALLRAGKVRKIVCSFPRQPDGQAFESLYKNRAIDLELKPQGTLAECIRAGGAGIGAFFTKTAYGTDLAAGKETRIINGTGFILEYPLRADFALIKGDKGDRWGNVTYRKTARNFGPIMATAADCTVVEVAEMVDLGYLDPESIITPGIYVDRLVQVRK